MMPTQVFPAISNKQYVLGMNEQDSPLFYMAWAYFTAEDEAKYIENTNMALTMDNWNQGIAYGCFLQLLLLGALKS